MSTEWIAAITAAITRTLADIDPRIGSLRRPAL